MKDYAAGFLLFPASMAAGYVAGAGANNVYNSMTPEQQAQWDQNRWMHHGTLGLLMVVVGGILVHPIYTPTLIGTGIGLAISDSKDLEVMKL